jgi:hypothetical protein
MPTIKDQPIAEATHAVFSTKADAEKYQALKDKAAGLPKMQGVPGGDDPTGRRHLYPSQTLTLHADGIVEAPDGTAFAVALDERIEPAKATKVAGLTDAKWTAVAVEAVAVKEVIDEEEP